MIVLWVVKDNVHMAAQEVARADAQALVVETVEMVVGAVVMVQRGFSK